MMHKIVKISNDDSELNSLISSSLGESMNADSLIDLDEIDDKTVDSDTISKNQRQTTSDNTELEKTLDAIHREFEDDVTLTIGNLKERAMMESAIKGKWASKLSAERMRSKILKSNHDELVAGLQKMYSSDSARSFLGGRQSTEQQIAGNHEIQQLRKEMADSRQIIDLLEYKWEIIKGFGFTIKNSIEALKLEMGI